MEGQGRGSEAVLRSGQERRHLRGGEEGRGECPGIPRKRLSVFWVWWRRSWNHILPPFLLLCTRLLVSPSCMVTLTLYTSMELMSEQHHCWTEYVSLSLSSLPPFPFHAFWFYPSPPSLSPQPFIVMEFAQYSLGKGEQLFN